MQNQPARYKSDSEETLEPLSKAPLCYQCKKCSSGCPVSVDMDLLPHQILRMIQLDNAESSLHSHTIWICASCMTCTTRCPNEIDIAGIMDSLRHMAVEKKIVSVKNIAVFHNVFLGEIKRFGRIHELSMIGAYKLLSRQWFQDLTLGIKMLAKGKMKLFPRRIKDLEEVNRLFGAPGRTK